MYPFSTFAKLITVNSKIYQLVKLLVKIFYVRLQLYFISEYIFFNFF